MLKFMKTTSSAAIAAAALTGLSGQASADIQHLDDVIITFSLCVGNDCVNGENFGFDTMRLKENNLRVHFDDTSVSASFPRNDWRIVVNDTSNGGGSYFAIEDSTAGRIPFRIEAGAPVNALYVEDDGDVGVGTATPVVNLHVVDGNTPTLRLEQNGSSGFTAQTWDLAGNEANFFIRDATNGSTLPFRVEPGAPSSTLYLDSTGRVGVGTTSPASAVHVLRSGAATDLTSGILVDQTNATEGPRGLLHLRNNGQVYMRLENTAIADGSSSGRSWNLQSHSGEFRVTTAGGPETELALDVDGNLTIGGSLTTTGAGACSAGCDRVFAEEYELASIQEHAQEMFSRGYLPNVGPTLEDAPFNVTEKVGRMLNELEHAHIYIAQQDDRLSVLEARLVALETQN